MAQTNISFELNDRLADEMDEICENLGLTPEEAFEIFARKVVNEQGIPFEVTEKEFPRTEKEEKIRTIAKIVGCIAAFTAFVSLIIRVVRLFKKKEERHGFLIRL